MLLEETNMVKFDSGSRWRISDQLWKKVEVLLPPRVNTHPRGGGRKPKPARQVIDAILFVLRTGCQWKALDATGICPGSTAHDWFQKWVEMGVFLNLWKQGLTEYDELKGIDWAWQSMDGAINKSPLGGEKNRCKPY
jgi:transposase